ncbi:hypothetical protein WMW71_12980 [Flavobacterium buctense]|uniref:DUF3108 domain-containing protein n=1 Tax=Flavobacterium buctense TaxID=1648146 RepID=A0ABU9E3L6_9FLAO|nr:hypothetical protein [Flavobacterium buctense]
MKFSLSILILFLINGQHGNVEGEYYNHFGSKLKINSDSTFLYTWHFDLESSWSKGTWKMKNDTINFKVIPVFDTLRRINLKDTLILSVDEKPELITEQNGSITHFLSSGGQNVQKMNVKLYFDGEKLIEIKRNGKLDKAKHKAFWENKKYYTWFVKRK